MTNNTTSSNATVVAAAASSGNCNFRPFTETEKWLQVSSFLIIDAISIFGNAVVICIIRRNQRLHSPTNYFIVNLCFANLMIMLVNTSPYILGRIAPQLGFGVTGIAGTILCKLQGFLASCTFNAAILTLAVIAADRFIAIFFPLRRALSSRKAFWLIAVTWLAPALPCSIFLYVNKLFEFHGTVYCVEIWEPTISRDVNTVYSTADFIVFYALPLLEIIILYSAIIYKIWMRKIPGQVTAANQQLELKAKKNVLKMLIIAVLTFALFWLPTKIAFFIVTFGWGPPCWRTPTFRFLIFFLAHVNCAVNPFIYIVFSRDYRNGFKAVFQCSLCFGGDLSHLHSRSVDMTKTTNSGRHSGLSLKSFKMVDDN